MASSASNPPPTEFAEDSMPPECSYSSREELLAGINAWAGQRGYAFVVSRSSKTMSKRTIVTYACDRCKKSPSRGSQNLRKTTTRSTGCLFSLLAKESLDHTQWVIVHRSAQYQSHNHEPNSALISHATNPSLPPEAIDEIVILVRAGIDLTGIRNVLRVKGYVDVTKEDLQYHVAKAKKTIRKAEQARNVIGELPT